jgi:hypothetical protein
MQLANFLRVPVVFFFEDFPLYQGTEGQPDSNRNEDLNYSFLAKLFSNLSEEQKEKIFQVLRNTRNLEKKTG